MLPAHVRHCWGTGSRDWWLYTCKRGDHAHALRTPYLCGSWRCPHCRVHESHVMYARIGEAIAPLADDGWVFGVLTLDRHGTYSGAPWKNADFAYAELSRLSRNLLSRVRRWQHRQGWRVTGREWIATVEAHRSGWPHVNIMLWSPMLAASLRADRKDRERRGLHGRDAVLVDGELLDHVTGAGWGIESTFEAARSAGAVASYITKLAGEAGAVAGELAKLSQLPTMAPARFRRLRSGKGFLPPRRKNPDYTGTLVRRTRDHDGTPLVMPLHHAPPVLHAFVVATCYAEEARMVRELSTASDGELVSSVVLPLPSTTLGEVYLERRH